MELKLTCDLCDAAILVELSERIYLQLIVLIG